MARRFTQIPESTFKEMQLDAGVLLNTFDTTGETPAANTDIICATTGGITVSAVPTYEDFFSDVDNAPNNTKEGKVLTGWECSMTFTALSVSARILALALGAADVDGSSVTPRKDLKQNDFQTVWWVGDRGDGGYVAVQMLNALSTGGLSLQTTKNGKGQLSVTLTGHVSIANQDVVPMEFYSEEGEVA